MGFYVCSLAFASGDRDKAFNEFKKTIQERGVSAGEIDRLKGPVKGMLENGAESKDIEGPLMDMLNRGVAGRDLKRAMDSMSGLIMAGRMPKEAGDIVIETVFQARSEGLKGAAFGERLYQVVRERGGNKIVQGGNKGYFESGRRSEVKKSLKCCPIAR